MARASQGFTGLSSIFSSLPVDALDLLEQMLRINPLERISAERALQHKYFQNVATLDKPSFMPFNPSMVTDNSILPFVRQFCGGLVKNPG